MGRRDEDPRPRVAGIGALFMVVSIFGFSDILNERHVILDPSRVAAQVASGIGFA